MFWEKKKGRFHVTMKKKQYNVKHVKRSIMGRTQHI